MYLSKLQINGFKSFAQKTKLDFNDGLTCIIGPNGSGKSNIVDAIRWVLGEQKSSSLRSEKMENVIFNGSKLRKPMGMSEVSMTIENNKKILDSEYEEIVIARRLYRSGESQYLINSIPVRLKDVVDLFMDTGMGANSYSVIELKMVESILSDDKAERRHLFEEAAGVVKYKTRRKSALRKLDYTQQDLVRINDIVTEVEKTVSSLSRQVSKARRYIALNNELQKSEVDLATFKYHTLKDQLLPLENELTLVSKEKEESSHQITLEEAILEDYSRQQLIFEDSLQQVNLVLYEKDNHVRQLNQEDAIAAAKIEDMKNNQKRYGTEIEDFTRKIAVLNENKTDYEKELTEFKEKHSILQQQFDKISIKKNEESEIINAEKAEIENLNNSFRTKLQALSEEKETVKQKEYRIHFENEQLLQIKNMNLTQDSDISKLKTQIQETENNRTSAESSLIETEKKLLQIKNELSALDEKIKSKQFEHNETISELEKVLSREAFFNNIISNYEGHSKSTQFVMSQKNNINGLYGPVSELIDAEAAVAFLVESILKDSVNFMVVKSTAVAKELIHIIKKENQGRVTCIPLDKINKIKKADISKATKGLEFLLNKISIDPKFQHLFYLLLGDVVVVNSLDEAISHAESNPELRFITNDGEMVNFNREISGGEVTKKETAIIGRKNILKELGKERQKLESNLQSIIKDLKILKNELERSINQQKEMRENTDNIQRSYYEFDNSLIQLRYQLTSIEDQIETAASQVVQIKENISNLQQDVEAPSKNLSVKQEELNNLEKDTISRTNAFEVKNEKYQVLLEEYQQVQLKLSNAQNQLKNRENDLERVSQNVLELQNSTARRHQEIEDIKELLVQYDQAIKNRKTERENTWKERDELDKKKQSIESEFQELKEKRHELEVQIKDFRRKHDSSLERTKKLEIKINEYRYQSEAIRSNIIKEYTVDIDALIPNQNLNEVETEGLIESVMTRIKNLGPVNPLAVSEYEKENKRLQFLTSQRDDLLKAEKSLLETIDKINITAREQFVETYTKVKENFEKVFSSFFPSGKGTLNIDPAEDPLEGDIEIEVTTKGRGLQTLALLSGGEKTLTAISLLFAIYLVKPSPFCILDEVDAPLDDVNISRFTEALKGFSNNTQFLVVTHNKRTMEAAETMYGVTMEEEGISKLVSVQFN